MSLSANISALATRIAQEIKTKVPATRQILAGAGLSGGGSLAADRTLSVVYGTTAGTAAAGNDARLSDARPPTAHTHTAANISDSTTVGRAVLTAADAAAARAAIGAGTSSLVLGTTAGTAAAGNDARLSDQRVPTAGSVDNSKVATGAAIALSKLATGYVAGSDNTGARTLTIWVGTEAQYTAIGTKDPNTLYFRSA